MDARADIRDLLSAARRGRPDAVGRIFETARAMLAELADRELPATVRAKVGPSDIVQETAVDMQRDFGRFTGTTAEECFAWLREILKHNVVDAVRRYQEADKRTVHLETSLSAVGRTDADQLVAGRVPEDSAIRREEAAALAAVIDRLPEEYRQVLRLRYWRGMSFVDMASQFDRSPEAVRKLWFRAVERLQAELAADGRRPPASD